MPMLTCLLSVLLLAASLTPVSGCTAGYTKYTDAGEWQAALQTGEGSHCLSGPATVEVVAGRSTKVPKGVSAEAHDVTFKGDGTKAANGGLLLVDNGASFKGSAVTFTGGKAFNGGGVFVMGAMTCDKCNFQNSQATNGGGAFVNAGGSLTCSSCNFKDNAAPEGVAGGLMVNAQGTATCTSCVFEGNTAMGPGGDIYNNGGAMTLTQVSFKECAGAGCGSSAEIRGRRRPPVCSPAAYRWPSRWPLLRHSYRQSSEVLAVFSCCPWF